MEITDGLRVLGVPVGSTKFCHEFIAKSMSKAASEAAQLLSGLKSEQTMLQLFRRCTVHKLTHLFAADVATAGNDVNDVRVYPQNWDCWTSRTTLQFHDMVESFLSSLTRQRELPLSAMLIAKMAVRNGGLGIAHPMSNAIPTFILNMRRCL